MSDSVVQKIHFLSFYSINDTAAFVIQRAQLDSLNNDLNSLPSDIDGLMETYRSFTRGFYAPLSRKGYILRDTTAVDVYGFTGYRLRVKNPVSGSASGECVMLVLNENMYVMYYLNKTSYSETVKNDYFLSLKIDKSSNPKQMMGQSYSYKLGIWTGKILVYGLVGFFIIYIIRRNRKSRYRT